MNRFRENKALLGLMFVIFLVAAVSLGKAVVSFVQQLWYEGFARRKRIDRKRAM